MGSRPSTPPPPPPPPPPRDEADSVDTARLLAQRASAAVLGFRRTFLRARPGGPGWQSPEATARIAAQPGYDTQAQINAAAASAATAERRDNDVFPSGSSVGGGTRPPTRAR